MFFYPLKEFVKDIQTAFGVEATGIAGRETLMETITLSEVLNRKHPAVYAVQRRLYSLGYTEVGKVNGIANGLFTAAVKRFQSNNGCVATGEITARDKTWKKLLGME
jgi:peptidoglycan hydrolase-like protein with peptidoglycan-binding domain